MPFIVTTPDHLARGPEDPPPPDWDEFRKKLVSKWTDLLDSNPDESAVQAFLERYPCLLPRPYTLFRGGHHGPFPSAVISQPIFPSYDHKRPDFMWLAADSMTFWAVPIEIERPGKRWFTANGQTKAELTQALDQIRSWKQWFEEPHNVQAFLEFYDVPRSLLAYRSFARHYVLIYGRRSEATASPKSAKRRRQLQQGDETLMTYDRLEPDQELSNFLTVTRDDGTYRASHVQPTVEINRFVASDWESVEGVEEAIGQNEELPDDRRAYLMELRAKWSDQLAEERAARESQSN